MVKKFFLTIFLFLIVSSAYCMENGEHEISIGQLDPVRWPEYRQLMISFSQDTPHASWELPSETEASAQDRWQGRLQKAKDNNGMWILFAFDDEKIVGTAGAERVEGECLSHACDFKAIYILPEYRGKRIAFRLMERLMETMLKDQTISMFSIWVTTTQEAAIKLYQRFGFTISGTISRAVKIGSTYYDNYLMIRLIDR